MGFEKYQHVSRLGTQDTEGILEGTCYIKPKLDGTNGSVWMEDGEIHLGSRRRELSLGEDNQGFFANFHKDDRFNKLFKDYPHLRLYGEYLKPHTIRTYDDNAWDEFYVFDVIDMNENEYLYPDIYIPILESYNIKFVPILAKINNPTLNDIKDHIDNNHYLLKQGSVGEGVVISNYDFRNRFDRVVWAKVIHSEFNNHTGIKGVYGKSSDDLLSVEDKIASKFCTQALIEKEYAKITQSDLGSKVVIPRLINTILHSIVTEDMWDIIKLYKSPTVNFKLLNNKIVSKIREYKPDLFVRTDS